MIKKKEGFAGQIAFVLPAIIQEELRTNPLTKPLFVTDIGYYPSARYHFRERPDGVEQHILIYCTEGKGWVEIDDNRKKVVKDQFFIIPANVPHKYGSDDSDPWTIYWLHFSGENATHLAGNYFSLIDIDPMENTRNSRRIRLFEELFQNFAMGYSTKNLEYSSLCTGYLLGAFNYLSQFERIRGVQQHDIIEKSILYMNENLEKTIDLNGLALLCGYSVSHYSTIFKRKTSRSPIEYFINLKIQRACQVLDFTDLNIKEIATQLAFDDQFYFSRIFKKIMGVSPKDYRKKKKG